MTFKKTLSLLLFAPLLVCLRSQASPLGGADIVSSLRNSSWLGSFGAIGLHGKIEIRFSPELTGDGQLRYMHELEGGGVLGTVLGPFDKACDFTPRTLMVSPAPQSAGFTGVIQVYKCSKTADEEKEREAHGYGSPQQTIQVQEVKLSDDRQSLEIVAKIAVATVTYRLSKVDPAAGATVGGRDPASALSPEEQEGLLALREVGFEPVTSDRRSLREAGLLKIYQHAWNDFDPTVTDPLKIANPGKIVSHYTDGKGLLYRDMCMSAGLTSKDDLKRYLSALYGIYPKQVWGDGWKNIHLFKGAAPGEWAYYYEFSMYKSMKPDEKPGLSGTGMEKVNFDTSGKLIGDEVHLILNSGTATCKFGNE